MNENKPKVKNDILVEERKRLVENKKLWKTMIIK